MRGVGEVSTMLAAAVLAVLAQAAAAGAERPAPPPLRTAVYVGPGAGGIGAVEWIRLVQESPEMELRLVDADGIGSGALDGLDLLVMPGGSSQGEYDALRTNGLERVKAFIRGGGGYIGTCAGCALVMDEKSRARMIPWKWSGSESCTIFPTFRLNERGAAALGLKAGPFAMRYHGGPFMWPSTNAFEGVSTESWATFDAEVSMNGRVKAKKRMHGSTAIVGGTMGRGRVFVTAAHPEYFSGTLYMVRAAIRYVSGRDVTFPVRRRAPRALSVGFLANRIDGVAVAETALAVAAEPGFDLVAVDVAGLGRRQLDHVDVLVLTNDRAAKDGRAKSEIADFVSRGGKVVGIGAGAKALPPGGVTCGAGVDAVRTIRSLFR